MLFRSRDYDRLKNLDYLFITFGTAWVFELMQESEYISCLDYEETSFSKIVGNCHKLPASLFKRRRLSVDEIYNLWLELIDELKLFNPNLKIIFTVSPIRHIKDTLHGNQISKSTLLLSLDRLCERYDNVDYFPAYEILNDD